VSELDWLSVVRVEKRDEDKQTTMVIADSGDTKRPFSQLSRYTVRFEMIGDIGTLSIYYQGIPSTSSNVSHIPRPIMSDKARGYRIEYVSVRTFLSKNTTPV